MAQMTSSPSAFISSQVSGDAVGTATTMRAGLLLPQRLDCGLHGGSGRQAVVDQNHSAAANIGGWTTAAVEALAPRQLLLLPRRDRIDHMVGNAKTA